MYGERMISRLLKICSHEILVPCVTQRESQLIYKFYLDTMFGSLVIKIITNLK